MLTINWACSSQIEHVHHKLSMFTINWACSPQIEHAHHKLSMFTMNYACSPQIEHVQKPLYPILHFRTLLYTVTIYHPLLPRAWYCQCHFCWCPNLKTISAIVQIWKLSLFLSKFENYLCCCPNLKTISVVVQVWKLSQLLSKIENYLKFQWWITTVYNSVQ